MGRYDHERPWHSWADVRVTVRLLPWHWRLVPRLYRDAGSLSTFDWLFLTLEYWNWDRRTQEQMARSVGGMFSGSWQTSENPYKGAANGSSVEQVQ